MHGSWTQRQADESWQAPTRMNERTRSVAIAIVLPHSGIVKALSWTSPNSNSSFIKGQGEPRRTGWTSKDRVNLDGQDRVNLDGQGEPRRTGWTWTDRVNLDGQGEPWRTGWTSTDRVNLDGQGEPRWTAWTSKDRVSCDSSVKITLDHLCFVYECPRREAGDVWCLPPVWNLRAVIWFHFAISSLVPLPSPVSLSDWSFFCLLVHSSELFLENSSIFFVKR